MRDSKRQAKRRPKEVSFCICHAVTDADWAEWLATELGEYRVPDQLVGKPGVRGDLIPRSLRDGTTLELPEENHALSKEEKIRLLSFDFLIVVCSPQSANSKAIGGRIAFYKAEGRSDRILAAIVDGVPGASENGVSSSECFHIGLRREIGGDGEITQKKTEPLAADFRLNGRHRGWHDLGKLKATLTRGGMSAEQADKAVQAQLERLGLMRLKLIAGMLGINLGELTQRESVYVQRSASGRRKILAVGALTAISLAAMLNFGLKNLTDAQGEAAVAETKARRAEELLKSNSRRLQQAKADSKSQADAALAAEMRLKGLTEMQKLSAPQTAGTALTARREAVGSLSKAAALGDSIAMLSLGILLTAAESEKDEISQGIDWLRKTSALPDAKEESSEAKRRLARIYDEGKLVPRNASLAVELCEDSAKGGNTKAFEPLAYMLERGMAGAERKSECLAWYQRAADAGDPEGHYALYLINVHGRSYNGMRKDVPKAEGHLRSAVEGGSPRALLTVGQRLPDSSAAGSHDANFRHLERAAAAGLIEARLRLADLHRTAKDRPPNLEACRGQIDQCLEEAARRGDNRMSEEAIRTAYRLGVLRDLKNKPLILQLAEKGSRLAYEAFADSLQANADAITDNAGYIKFMRIAAEKGNVSASYKLGRGALLGVVRGVSKEEALGLLNKSADMKYAPSLYFLADAYRQGRLVPKDWQKSASFAKEALKIEKNPGINWAQYPLRFRPDFKPEERAWNSPATRSPLDIDEQKKVETFLKQPKPTMETLEGLKVVFDPKRDVPPEILLDVGRKLLSVYDPYVAEPLLIRCAAESAWDERFRDVKAKDPDLNNAGHQAALALASHFRYKDAEKHAKWTVIAAATARLDAKATPVIQPYSRTSAGSSSSTERSLFLDCKPAQSVKIESVKSAAFELESNALLRAATAAGFPPPQSSKPDVTPERALILLNDAKLTLAQAEFPEDIEEALGRLTQAANCETYQAEAARLAAECSGRLGLAAARFYWNLRCAQSKSPAGFFTHQEASHLALAYATGEGTELDPVEAKKWCSIAAYEIFCASRALGARAAFADESLRSSNATLRDTRMALEKYGISEVTDESCRIRRLLYLSLSNPDGQRKL